MFDVIIIGAGVTGLGAAWHLTETMKKKVLLLEQFPFPHQFGSSAGHSRIIRQLYKEDFNCTLMKEAVQMWRDLESKTGKDLFIQNELINFGRKDEMKDYVKAMKANNISAREINHVEAKEKFPIFNIPEDYCIISDPVAGVLRADKCLRALLEQSIRHGLEFHEMEKVLDISVKNETEVEVLTKKGKYHSKSVIIATGIWSQIFLQKMDINFPLKPKKIYYALFKPKDEANFSLFDYDNFPSFMSSGYYGLAGQEYPGCLKIGDFTGEEIDPDKRDNAAAPSESMQAFLKNIQSFLQTFIPQSSVFPVNVTPCVITNTPDDQPIIDCHKTYENVIIGCGFSGSGFKSGVIHGKLLAELATNTHPSYDIKPFSISRFDKK